MAFKKHNWVKYGRKGMMAELKILDEDRRTLDFFRWSTSDKKSENRILDILKKSFGINFSPTIKTEESINNKTKKVTDKDLTW